MCKCLYINSDVRQLFSVACQRVTLAVEVVESMTQDGQRIMLRWRKTIEENYMLAGNLSGWGESTLLAIYYDNHIIYGLNMK